MCLFPQTNNDIHSIAYKKGLVEFDCGACPECLAKRSRLWALRACYEARTRKRCGESTCMVTLTYDQYKYNSRGQIIGEEDPDPTLHVQKRHAQLFIKRLRKYFGNQKIKYLLTAEYGKSTHRAHYHAILFGVHFPDLYFYKKSKRGNLIYKSRTLTKLWSHGICTVDAVNVSAQIARYCTKYCAKDSRADDTFMLVSRGIGEEGLLRDFNGKSYWIDGREYPVPKQIWNKVIQAKYEKLLPDVIFDYRYVNKPKDESLRDWRRFSDNVLHRQTFMRLRDNDEQYKSYLAYWMSKSLVYEAKRPSVPLRILALPNEKYFGYKQAALKAYNKKYHGREVIPPRSGCKARYNRWLFENSPYLYAQRKALYESHLPEDSRHYRANDTIGTIMVPIPYEKTPFD